MRVIKIKPICYSILSVIMAVTLFSVPAGAEDMSGPLVVYQAASLSVPFLELEKEFERLHPTVDVQREPGPSRILARKITELQKNVDIIAVADTVTIPSILMPRFADWSVNFAREEMAILYTSQSTFAQEITAKNWPQVLLRPGVEIGISDPDVAPVGYRALLTWKLAEKFYHQPGLYEKLREKVGKKNMRQDAVALLSLLKAGALDYVFDYHSLAQQHGFQSLELPGEVNLSDPEREKAYSTADVTIAGKEPGATEVMKGKPIVYSMTIVKNAPNQQAAEAFLRLLFSPKGQETITRSGMTPIFPAIVSNERAVPQGLRAFVKQK